MRIRSAAILVRCALAPACSAQTVGYSNHDDTFRWTPALDNQSGVPLLAETLLDITMSSADNAAGLAPALRGLSYGYYTPPTSEGILLDRITRSFPTGLAGIAAGAFVNTGADAGFYAAVLDEGDSIGPHRTYTTNAAIAIHTTEGSQQTLGERITIGVRIPAGLTEESFHYGYITLQWRQSLAFDNLTGGTSTLNLYQPVAWAYETTPDTPVTVTAETNCPADTNGDGSVTPADFSAWIAAFNSSAPACDQNGDALCTPADFSAWIANFNAGC